MARPENPGAPRVPADACRNGEAGASAVEFALVLPLLLILLLGAITGALAYNRDVTLTHAAREAARWAATLAVPDTAAGDPVPTTWFEQVVDRAEASASGDLRPGVDGRYICVAYVEEGVNEWRYEESGSASGSVTSGQCPFDDGIDSPEPRVQVVVGRDTDINAVFVRKEVSLRSEAVARYEHESPYPEPTPSPSP